MTRLTVQNAEIRTATVQVQALTIGKKQVTQSVFKQLPDKELIADDGTLNGEPWGWVNYHPGKCDDREHLHFVWRQDRKLFRTSVEADITHPRWIDAEAASAWIDAKIHDEVTSNHDGWKLPRDEFLKVFLGVSVRMTLTAEAQDVALYRERLEDVRRVIGRHGPTHPLPDPRPGPGTPRAPDVSTGRAVARAAALAAARRARTVPASEVLAYAEERLKKALAALPGVPLAEAEARLTAEVRVEADRRRRHRDVREALAALPQLFIAV